MLLERFEVIDAHCHIYPEKIARKAAQATGDFYGEPPAEDGTVERLLESGAQVGIDRFIVQSVATTPQQVRKINQFIHDEVAAHPQKLVGLGTLHPDSEDIEGDIRHLQSLGLKGVKLHPDIQGFKIDDYRCLKIYEICEREGLPILMHTGDSRYDYSNPNRMLPILEIYSKLTVIGAHFGGFSVWEEACERLSGCPNLVVDCSSSLGYITPTLAKKLIAAYGTNRVLFGTDYPLHFVKDEVEMLLSLGLSDEDYRKIFSENAKRVYGLK